MTFEESEELEGAFVREGGFIKEAKDILLVVVST